MITTKFFTATILSCIMFIIFAFGVMKSPRLETFSEVLLVLSIAAPVASWVPYTMKTFRRVGFVQIFTMLSFGIVSIFDSRGICWWLLLSVSSITGSYVLIWATYLAFFASTKVVHAMISPHTLPRSS